LFNLKFKLQVVVELLCGTLSPIKDIWRLPEIVWLQHGYFCMFLTILKCTGWKKKKHSIRNCDIMGGKGKSTIFTFI
jgi:hypothetical protein